MIIWVWVAGKQTSILSLQSVALCTLSCCEPVLEEASLMWFYEALIYSYSMSLGVFLLLCSFSRILGLGLTPGLGLTWFQVLATLVSCRAEALRAIQKMIGYFCTFVRLFHCFIFLEGH